MASIELRNIRKAFGAVEVIKGVDLEVRKARRAAASPPCCA